MSIADLKGYVTAETNFPPQRQQFYLDGQPIVGDNQTLEQVGIKDGEMIAVLIESESAEGQRAQQQQQTQSQPQRAGQGGARPMDYSNPDQIERTRLNFLSNPSALQQARNQRPDLAAAINNPQRFRQLFEEALSEESERDRERQNQMRLLNEDPFNVDAQRKIEEMIRQERVTENLQHAYEHNPEGMSHCIYCTIYNANITQSLVALPCSTSMFKSTAILSRRS